MQQTLVLYFLDASGKVRKIRIDDPKENLLASEVKDAMDIIIDRNIFAEPALVSAEKAELVTVETTEIDIDQVV